MLEKLPQTLGHVLREQRAGLDTLLFNRCGLRAGHGQLQLASLAFADHAPMPARYTADGEGLSPPLQWTGVPAGAGQLVLLVEDADAPMAEPLVHAIVVDLPPEDGALAEGAMPGGGQPGEVHEGRNSLLRAAWLPPDPPPGHGTHRYAFQLFALAPGVRWSGAPGRSAVAEAVHAHAIASGLLVGTYARPDGSVRDDEPVTLAAPLAGP
ncbi:MULTISPECIES: YbhB/YbcL family Raf kinase inhibitor-like protein [Ramlibacter]|uniref:YbhB/YbcL family Raf kinase inhibitor-like protein n=1 Tax=Ramlibacter aquaticus TaxID=2780094 RepID=A0ABR9SHF3_9BURK|nr:MULTISPECIES: YbhB/YbcL family Raf kinase inhibitor-like protein [Ramlibacter]MBE7941783.1 YbhB/YbcL family Raf kinase inhibitor-like protein [Ramlibacter aquaticus]